MPLFFDGPRFFNATDIFMTIVDRLFYKLTDLADRWQCSVEDILHLGMQNKAVICANFIGNKRVEAPRSDFRRDPPPGWPQDMLIVSNDCLRALEQTSEANYLLQTGEWIDQGERCYAETYPGVYITRDNLCMLHDHMLEIQKTCFPAGQDEGQVDVAPPSSNSTWPWGKYETQELRYLRDTALHFWVNYDPNDPETAPTKREIVPWLLSRMPAGKESGRLAARITSILTPDGLRDGPRRHRMRDIN